MQISLKVGVAVPFESTRSIIKSTAVSVGILVALLRPIVVSELPIDPLKVFEKKTITLF